MKGKDQKRKEHSIPVSLTEEQFAEFFLDTIPKPKRGPQSKLPPYKTFNYIMTVIDTGCQWEALPIEKDVHGVREICYSRVFRTYQKWLEDEVFHKAFGESVARLFQDGKLDISIIHGDGSTTTAKKGGDQIGYNGHKKTKGEKVVCFTDRNCNVLSPFTPAPGNGSEMKLWPKALDDLKGFLKSIGMSLKGARASFDAGYDSKANRQLLFNAGMIANIKDNTRNRKHTKRGRKRFYRQDVFEERFFTVERVFAWEDKFKRLLLRFEHISFHHFGFKLLAYTMINLRHYCK